jgi:integrase/recombinase XerD
LQEHYKPETVNSYVFKISPTVKYGIEKGYIKEEIEFTHCKEQEHIKDIYTDDELRILLKRPDTNEFVDIRAWVIINTLISTGIRAKELRKLKISDINLDNGYMTLNYTKNKQARVIPISSTLFIVLSEWLTIRNASREDYVFCNIFGEPLQRTATMYRKKRYSKKHGISKYGLHMYRHTFITLSVRKGMSPVLLKRITGHSNYKILDKYYSFNPTDLVNTVDIFNPLEDFKPKQKRY